MLREFTCVGLCAFTFLAAGQDAAPLTAPAVGDIRYDPSTGTDRSRWPKARPFDFERLTLEIDLPDVQVPVLTGIATYRATPVAFSQEFMILDCDGPVVSAVSINGSNAAFTQEGNALRIALPSLPPGRSFTAAVKYSLDFSANKGLGLTWVGPADNAATDAALSPMIHSQGQSELNSKWFPCFDAPNDRLATELIVTVDADYEVISNGKLISRSPAPVGSVNNPRSRWTWRQERPHPIYLQALAIGKWSTVQIPGSSVPLTVHGPPGSEDDLRLAFANTPDMIDFYEQTFGLPYPWDRYAQVLVRKLDAGGMENTAATFIRESTFTEQPSPGPGSLDGLIAHELAHQWFGNLITCRSWSHLWLNEGLATYAEALWREHAETPEAYLAEVRAATRSLIAKDTAPAPQAPALVSHVYTNPDDRFGIAANPYSKGMMILHMLRRKIGDGPFFAGLRTYARTHADGTVETADLRRAFEASSGVSLERFFDQWTLRPGVPRLRVEASWNPATQTLSVECDQTQHIDRLNPAYALDVPIHILFEDGTVRVVTLTTDSEKISAKFVVSEGAASNPVSCEFDPQVHALASILPRAIDLRTGAVLPDWEREPEPVLLGSPDDANAEMQPAQIPADEPTPTQP